jgi:hypothetical protein
MNLNQKKNIVGPLFMYGMVGTGYGFFMKAEGPTTSTMKIMLSVSGAVCLIAAMILQKQINNHPRE